MNRTRLLAFDLDGTLLDPSHRIPEMTRFLLSSLREAGIETTVATGRPYAAVQGFIGELAVRVPLIVFNGAVVVSPDGECLWSRRLPRDVAGGALSLLHDPAVANHLYLDPTDAFFYTDHMGAAAEHVMKKDGMGGRLDVDLAGLLGKRAKDPVKLFSIGPRKKLEEAKRRFDASAPECTCVFSEHDMLEFLGPDVTKGAALGILCDAIGIPTESVIAFGDNLNDLEMLRAAGHGVAMASAPKELKLVADSVVEDIAEFLHGRFDDHGGTEDLG
jgi:Cof subfamily protein (haloacid dehalogenase superfamily)